jgi:CubicO group peptidase (beta-lactamase class C family)
MTVITARAESSVAAMDIQRRAFLGGVLLVAACGTPAVAAASRTDPWRELDGYLRQLPGFTGVAMVARAGRPVLSGAYGRADRARGVPNSARTVFDMASMGKMLTAVAIGHLAAARRLAVTDPVDRYVRGLPAGITIHHLLTHTSGLGDVLRRTPDSGPPPSDLRELVRRIAAEPAEFAPGQRFGYSNSGFIVLGAVIEAVTGRPWTAAVRPGMPHTRFGTYRPADVPGMAHGYAEDGTDTSGLVEVANPSGGAATTAGDMIGFGVRVLRDPAARTLLVGRVDTPRGDRYGYGFQERYVNGVRVVGHNGGSPGYESQLDLYPDRDLAVVIMANADRVLLPAVRKAAEIATG